MTNHSGVSRFRKKPVVIEAVQWDGEHYPQAEWMPAVLSLPEHLSEAVKRGATAAGQITRHIDFLHIGTKEGVMAAAPGDWIIRGIAGEIYPCKPDIFAMTYEPVEVDTAAPPQPIPTPDEALREDISDIITALSLIFEEAVFAGCLDVQSRGQASL